MRSIRRLIVWFAFRARRWTGMLVMLTCCLMFVFGVLQDFDFENHPLVIDPRIATSKPKIVTTLKPTPNLIKVYFDKKVVDKREEVPKRINFYEKLKVQEDLKHRHKVLDDEAIIRANMANASKKQVKLLSYSKQFSFPLEIDLPREVDKILHGNSSAVKPINLHPYNYIHGAYDFCDKANLNFRNNELFLLILVKSSVSNFERRSTIRLSWNNYTYYKNINFKTLFLIAYNESVQSRVATESSKYNDIVQENFQEAYLNNTLKTIMGFNWAVRHCKKARYLFFVDDDYFVHVGNLANYLSGLTLDKEQGLLSGYLLPRSVPYRDNQTKWYITLEDYPFDRWPPYLAGGAFITSMILAQKLQIAFSFVKYIGIDDSYLGIVAKKLGIHLSHSNNFCYRVCKTRLKTAFASHGFDKPEDMMGAWKNQYYNKIVYVFKEKKVFKESKVVVKKKS